MPFSDTYFTISTVWLKDEKGNERRERLAPYKHLIKEIPLGNRFSRKHVAEAALEHLVKEHDVPDKIFFVTEAFDFGL